MGVWEDVERNAVKALEWEKMAYGSSVAAEAIRRQEEMDKLLHPYQPYSAVEAARAELERMRNPLGLPQSIQEMLDAKKLIEEHQHQQILKGIKLTEDLRRMDSAVEDARRWSPSAGYDHMAEALSLSSPRTFEMPRFPLPPMTQPRKRRKAKRTHSVPPAPAPKPRTWLHGFLQNQEQHHGIIWKVAVVLVGIVLAVLALL